MTAWLKDVIGYGTHAARPAAGNAGVLYYETDTQTLFRDNGTTWDALTAASAASYAGARYHQVATTLQGIPNNTTTVINFDTQDWDTGPFVTTGAAWKFTAASGGKYHVEGGIMLDAAAWPNNTFLSLELWKNGAKYSNLGRPWVAAPITQYIGAWGGDSVMLAAGDYIDLRVQHTQGGSVSLIGDVSFNHLAITKIG